MPIAIIDYGMGNIHSVQKALEFMGAKTIVTNKARGLADCQKIVLPGVGAFADAMQELEKKDLAASIREQIKNRKPILGICLGMQLFFETSEEAKSIRGLGILEGKVKKFKIKSGVKIPQIGWNQLKIVSPACPLLKGLPDNSYVYFCHSYYPLPDKEDLVAATTEYGNNFSSVVWKDHVYGTQFHPEKSQDVGLKILKNFIELC